MFAIHHLNLERACGCKWQTRKNMAGQMYSEWELVAAYSSAKVGHHRNLRRLSRHVSQNTNRAVGKTSIKK